jgi:hypothetical protein
MASSSTTRQPLLPQSSSEPAAYAALRSSETAVVILASRPEPSQ